MPAIVQLLLASGAIGPLVNLGMGALRKAVPSLGGWPAALAQGALAAAGVGGAGLALGVGPEAIAGAVPMAISSAVYQWRKDRVVPPRATYQDMSQQPRDPDWDRR